MIPLGSILEYTNVENTNMLHLNWIILLCYNFRDAMVINQQKEYTGVCYEFAV